MRRDPRDFDQTWLRLFIATLGLWPSGSRVLLDDGSHAVVLRQTGSPAEPVVRLLTGPGDGDLPAGAPDVIALGQPVDGRVLRIERLVAHDRLVVVPGPERSVRDQDAGEAGIPATAHACLPRGHVSSE
jgi:hypothetical protein